MLQNCGNLARWQARGTATGGNHHRGEKQQGQRGQASGDTDPQTYRRGHVRFNGVQPRTQAREGNAGRFRSGANAAARSRAACAVRGPKPSR